MKEIFCLHLFALCNETRSKLHIKHPFLKGSYFYLLPFHKNFKKSTHVNTSKAVGTGVGGMASGHHPNILSAYDKFAPLQPGQTWAMGGILRPVQS